MSVRAVRSGAFVADVGRTRFLVVPPAPRTPPFVGNRSHSWYFGNLVFAADLFATLVGKERSVIPTRKTPADGSLQLQHV